MSLGMIGGGARPHNFNVPLMNINDGNLTFVGKKQRIYGFMSGSPQSLHLAFQNTAPASNSILYIAPSAVSGGAAGWTAANAADIDNASFGQFACDAVSTYINSGLNGTGAQLPIAFRIANVEVARISTNGNLIINSTTDLSSSAKLQVTATGASDIDTVTLNGSADGNGINVKMIGNGVTTPNKFIRVISGSLQIVNSAYTASIVTINDIGDIVGGGIFENDSQANTRGYMVMTPSDATHTGYIEWHSANGNRQGYMGFSTSTGAGDTGTIPLQCGTLAIIGGLTVSGNVALPGTVTIATPIIANDIGGTTGGQIELRNIASGATNIHKYIRVNSVGSMEWVNSAYTAIIMTLTDGGGLANGPSGYTASGAAATQVNALTINQFGQPSWVIYQAASDPDFRIFGNGADRVILRSGGNFQANGSLIANVAPATAWGLDLTNGTLITLANNATYDFAAGSGFHMFYDDSGGGAAYAFSVFGLTVVTNFAGTLFNNVLGTAGKMNFAYNGSTAYRLENKTGGSKTIYLTCIRARQAN